MILVTILDAIRERWYLFVPGIVLLGIAFLILWINKDKSAEGQYESIDPIGKAIHDWEKSVQKGGVEKEKRSKKRRGNES